jgi:hypothetical protein
LRRIQVFSHETDAVIGQPISLLIIFIVAGIIILLLFLAVPPRMKDSEIQRVEAEITKVLTEARNMFEYADNGSITTVPVQFPTSMRYLIFGSFQRNSTNEPTNLTLDEKTSNNYYFVMKDGTVRTYHSNARFSNHNMTKIAVFYPGTKTITLEVCQREGKTYVTMQ